MNRVQIIIVSCSLGAAAMIGAAAARPRNDAAPSNERSPSDQFFDALLKHPEKRLESRRALQQAVLKPDADARHILLLGLNELWLAAENQPDRLDRFNHAVLARHWLRRAEQLLPDDDRIPSWRWAAEWAVAAVEHEDESAAAAREMLRKLAEHDPCFHSVAFGVISFEKPAKSEEFRQAHAAMEAAFQCAANDPSIQDRPRWPHNAHAFLTALADFRLKAGDVRGAEAALVIAEARPGFDTWKNRHIVADRLTSLNARRDLYANDNPEDDPAFVFERGGPVSCTGCHGE